MLLARKVFIDVGAHSLRSIVDLWLVTKLDSDCSLLLVNILNLGPLVCRWGLLPVLCDRPVSDLVA